MLLIRKVWDSFSHVFLPRFSNNQRPKILHPAGLSVLVGIFLLNYSLRTLITFIPNLVLGYASSVSVEEVITMTNAERAKSGLTSLSQNPQLTQAAMAKASDMFLQDYWAHVSPTGVQPWKFIKDTGYVYRHAGENLARDFSNTPDVLNAWLASPTHKDNLLNGNYTDIGVAVVDGSLGGVETRLVVQMFAAPAAVPVAASVPEPVVTIAIEPEAAPLAEPVEEIAQAPVVQELEQLPVTQEETLPLPQTRETVIPAYEIKTTELIQEEPVTQPVETTISQAPVNEGRKVQKLVSPNQITQAFGLMLAVLIMGTLLIDWVIAHRRKSVRLVGRNFAHLIFIGAVTLLLLEYSQGRIL